MEVQCSDPLRLIVAVDGSEFAEILERSGWVRTDREASPGWSVWMRE